MDVKQSARSAIIFEEGTFCPKKVQEIRNASREDAVEFVRARIVDLKKIINARKVIGREVWQIVGHSKEDLKEYFESLSGIVICHPVAGELYSANYEAFYKILPPHER